MASGHRPTSSCAKGLRAFLVSRSWGRMCSSLSRGSRKTRRNIAKEQRAWCVTLGADPNHNASSETPGITAPPPHLVFSQRRCFHLSSATMHPAAMRPSCLILPPRLARQSRHLFSSTLSGRRGHQTPHKQPLVGARCNTSSRG